MFIIQKHPDHVFAVYGDNWLYIHDQTVAYFCTYGEGNWYEG